MTTIAKRKTKEKLKGKKTPSKEFRELVASLKGSMPWLNITVDSYLAEKHNETNANVKRG